MIKTLLIIYIILAIIFFFIFYVAGETVNKQKNEIFGRKIYHTSIGKVVLMGLLFPFVIIMLIISGIIDSSK